MVPKQVLAYSLKENPDRCVVTVYKLYMSHCPSPHPGPFYLRPLVNPKVIYGMAMHPLVVISFLALLQVCVQRSPFQCNKVDTFSCCISIFLWLFGLAKMLILLKFILWRCLNVHTCATKVIAHSVTIWQCLQPKTQHYYISWKTPQRFIE